MAYETVTLSFPEAAISVITLNRPTFANALNRQMGLELKDIFASLDHKTLRAVILTGAGKHFCAGADLKERKGMNEAQWHDQHAAFECALRAILACPLPVIAAVNGAAMGGGLELALACDFIYANSSAKFGLTEATLGIMPGLGGTTQLIRRIGEARAKELLYTGRIFNADEAIALSVVNKLCSNETLMDETLQTAQNISVNAPLALKAIKKAAKECGNLSLHDALATELQHYNMLLCSKDRHEGINAFNEKRKPVFTGE
ncbi:MAG: enoyl-CoA hydratase/isomerase family protein [Alphaproteobacteria bacterium]